MTQERWQQKGRSSLPFIKRQLRTIAKSKGAPDRLKLQAVVALAQVEGFLPADKKKKKEVQQEVPPAPQALDERAKQLLETLDSAPN